MARAAIKKMVAEKKRKEFSEVAVQDVARYQDRLVELMFHTDDKALRMISIYGTFLGLLATSGFALANLKSLHGAGWGFLLGAGVALTAGCVFAYRAMWTTGIYLPGRKPDFWLWCLGPEILEHEALAAYLKQAAICIEHNQRISDAAAEDVRRCFLCGISSPIVGLIASAAAWRWLLF